MIIESKEIQNKNQLQELVYTKSPKKITFYETPSQQSASEVIDYERKKGTIKAVIVLR